MNILVTGGSGMVGKYVVDELLRSGAHTVGVLDIITPAADVKFHKADVLDLDAVTRALEGYDAVIHMAGIPHPLANTAKEVFTLNVNGTFNVCEAAATQSVSKVIFTSSESTLGFAFMTNLMSPLYIPIDERHALRPQDPYGLSKIACEEICRSYSARYSMRTVCLREPWIWVPEAEPIAFYKTLVAEYKKWPKNLWTYVHVYDVAKAHRLAVETDLAELHEVLFITGPSNWTERPTRELVEEFYPQTMRIEDDPDGHQAYPLISHRKAAQLLGYKPEHSWHDLF
ncbi:MAG TPA: NAD(P)-dependent oxidoreductase [Bacteroidota bacterium]|nr:NAD(P)-dependent oxidoreductase [Bacteroidota bacterium]